LSGLYFIFFCNYRNSTKARESEEKEKENNAELEENDEDENGKHEDMEEDLEDLENAIPEKAVLPRGLLMWREGVKQAKTAAQLAMAFYVLETSIAWHKSIMKAFCQLCHCGDNEDSLLLCDCCDKGYHTYCFKPSLDNIPDGDWYCYECINKATATKHCLVCGKQDGKNLIPCATCPRAYHTGCLSPALSKVITKIIVSQFTSFQKFIFPLRLLRQPKKSARSVTRLEMMLLLR
jgi:hypothetical protein